MLRRKRTECGGRKVVECCFVLAVAYEIGRGHVDAAGRDREGIGEQDQEGRNAEGEARTVEEGEIGILKIAINSEGLIERIDADLE